LCVCLGILYAHKFVPWKNDVYVSCVKIQNLVLKNGFVRDIFVVYFTEAIKNIGFLRNLTCTHRILRCKREIFFQIFLTFRNIIFQWQKHMLPCAELNFHKFLDKPCVHHQLFSLHLGFISANDMCHLIYPSNQKNSICVTFHNTPSASSSFRVNLCLIYFLFWFTLIRKLSCSLSDFTLSLHFYVIRRMRAECTSAYPSYFTENIYHSIYYAYVCPDGCIHMADIRPNIISL
jgi:hypothetical protein